MLRPTPQPELVPDAGRARSHRLGAAEPEVDQEACTAHGVELLLAALERHEATKPG